MFSFLPTAACAEPSEATAAEMVATAIAAVREAHRVLDGRRATPGVASFLRDG